MESINQITTGELISLSEQELIDCDRGKDNFGCDGGGAVWAFEFIVRNGGIVEDKDYPYTGNDTAACKAIEVCKATINDHFFWCSFDCCFNLVTYMCYVFIL